MKHFEDYLEDVKDAVNHALSSTPLPIRTYTNYLTKSEGKYIRAQSVLVCAEQQDGTVDADAIRFAAAIEILHLATLVHDDVMDNADMRRGIPTVHSKYGRKTAVITGDYLMAVALNLMNGIEDRNRYIDFDVPNYMEEIALGELKQHLNNGNVDLSIKAYYEIIRGKTAALFEASFYAGAVVSLESDSSFATYRKLGHNIGMIFQLMDDCLDFDDTRTRAKKPVQSDFEQGVVTLPLIYAFEQEIDARDQARDGKLNRQTLNQLVKRCRGVDYTRKQAYSFYEDSLSLIASLDITDQKRQRLVAIAARAMGVA